MNGIIVGKDQIPIDEETFGQLGSYGFNAEYARKCIEMNKHNHVTSTYYLLLCAKKRQTGFSSRMLSILNDSSMLLNTT